MIKTSSITIPGVIPGSENPLPRFKAVNREHKVDFDASFRDEDKILFAYETGFRVLPYRMQDSYSRNRQNIKVKTIELENERLKAVFYPEYGGRLASLFDKKLNRELLFRNPVFQPANLAVRDCWFSGGIEWNIGIFGHTPLTCSPLFFGTLRDKGGNEVLRAWEYERCRGLFYSMDFHLPPGAEQLAVHVRIVNGNDTEVPMYWWTNIAVPEDRNTRVFSPADEVIYIKPESNLKEGNVHAFGRAPLVDLPSLPSGDASYPANFDFSSEYFFQTGREESSPWEAATLKDGNLFFERSTSSLRYRKMFCWGMQKGGRHWCDFLSEPGQGDYLEIQAGMAPTQLHGLKMPGSASWEFSQFFGGLDASGIESGGDWKESRNAVSGLISSALNARKVEELHRDFRETSLIPVNNILHMGSGWGALESKRLGKTGQSTPGAFVFPESSLTDEQSSWIELLDRGTISEQMIDSFPPSYMVDLQWKEILEKACSDEETKNPWPLIHLGILLYENNEELKARELWELSLKRKSTALAWRNLSLAAEEGGESERALEYMSRAVDMMGSGLNRSLCEEQMKLFINMDRHAEAWNFFTSLKPSLAGEERIISLAAIAAYETAHFDYLESVFNLEFASVKEGETRILDLWYAFNAQRLAHIRNVPLDEGLLREARESCPPPAGIDFRMSQ